MVLNFVNIPELMYDQNSMYESKENFEYVRFLKLQNRVPIKQNPI